MTGQHARAYTKHFGASEIKFMITKKIHIVGGGVSTRYPRYAALIPWGFIPFFCSFFFASQMADCGGVLQPPPSANGWAKKRAA